MSNTQAVQQPIVLRMGCDIQGFYNALRNAKLNPEIIEIDSEAAKVIRRQQLVYNKSIKAGDRIYFSQHSSNADRVIRHWLVKV